MIRSIKVLKSYYKLTGVKPIFVVLEFIFLLVPAMLSIYSAVLAANVITSLTVYDYNGAIFELSLNFGIIVISAISYFIYYLISKKVNRTIAKNLNEFVYQNVRLNQNVSRISLATLLNISTCVDFNKNFLYKLCFFIKAIITIIIVLYHSWILGLGLVAISLIMGICLKFTDKAIQKKQNEISEIQSKSLDLFNSIQKGSRIEENQNLETRLKDKYFNMVATHSKTKNKIALFYNINNNFISLILKSAVFGFTIYLLLLVKATTLTLSLYLILTPYLTSSAENLLEFFELFSEIGTVDNILSNFDSLKFRATIPEENTTKKELDIDSFNLYFYHTTLEKKLKKSEISNSNFVENLKVDDVNLKIESGSTISFVGDNDSGALALYKLILKEEACSSGSIFLDYKNIAEINSETYKTLVASASPNAYFYNISILENLMFVCDNKNKIYSSLKAFGLKTEIDSYKNKLNTIVDENFNRELIYFLSILRAYVSGAKIICIYGVPENFNRQKIQKLMHIIKFLKGKATLILFAKTDIFKPVCKKTYYFENGKIINIEK